MDDETFKRLRQTDWGSVGKELTAHAIWRARTYAWKSGNAWELAAGRTPVDVVQDVIAKTLSGERNWDCRKGELLPWLKDQVNSVMDALVRSASHRHEYYMPQNDDEPGDNHLQPFALTPSDLVAANSSLSPEESAIRQEELQHAATAVDALFASLAGEAELERVVDVVMQGCEAKPRLIAQELGVPVDEVNNRLKRLKRKALTKKKEKKDGRETVTRRR